MSEQVRMDTLRPGTFVRWSTRHRKGPGWVVQENGCHRWTGSTNGSGYGHVSVGGRLTPIHRARYEREVGPIPPGMYLDHLCENRLCCNPDHCRPATPRENTLRGDSTIAARNLAKTHCIHGHELAGENLIIRPRGGGRDCRTCRRAGRRRKRQQRRAA